MNNIIYLTREQSNILRARDREILENMYRYDSGEREIFVSCELPPEIEAEITQLLEKEDYQ